MLKGENLVVCAPTASGKTLIAEIAILKQVLERNVKALYLTPLRALASEKFEELSFYSNYIGLKVALTTGDYDSSDPWLEKYDIIITTNEKADSLLRHKATWLESIGIVVSDEIHLLNEPRRGPTLEIVLSKFLDLSSTKDIQILALSATIGNSAEIADWLNAKLVVSEWRPVELIEGVYIDGKIHYSNGLTREIPSLGNPIIDLTVDCLREGGEILIFANTRQRAVSLAKRIMYPAKKFLTREDASTLAKAAKDLLKSERNYLTEALASCLINGVAFHHAGLSHTSRRLIEKLFRQRIIKAVVATPTLAAGVNLPARRVVISDYRRFNGELGIYEEIPVIEYKQMCLPFDTLVDASEGKVPIGELVELRKNINVYSLNSENQRIQASPVHSVYSRLANILVEVSTSNGLSIKITPEHEIAVVKRHKVVWWKPAIKLSRGENVLFYNDRRGVLEPCKVRQVKVLYLPYPIKVYNIGVEGNENYFANGILVHNCGRAGRPSYDKKGEAITIARNRREVEFIFDAYISSRPEDISSKLSSEPALRSHVLALISTTYINSIKALINFLQKTFYAHQYDIYAIKFRIERILSFLKENNFIIEKNHTLVSTSLGKRVTELYIDPYTAAIILRGLRSITDTQNTFPYLYLISYAPETPIFYLRRGEKKAIESWLKNHATWIINSEKLKKLVEDDYELRLARIKTALILYNWINEIDENIILERFEIGPGDLHALTQVSEWLLYSAYELAKLSGMSEHLSTLHRLRERVKHGVKDELIELVRIKGIGRKRARILYNHGIRGIADLINTPPQRLLALPLMGRELVKKIFEQLGEPIDQYNEFSFKEEKKEKEEYDGTLDSFL
ncbi:MAG: DEAD/DEAH box helicase [Thermoproteales archaeon]|nr:DEAD/DEAH box helicase [Thermoproteales archaeon]